MKLKCIFIQYPYGYDIPVAYFMCVVCIGNTSDNLEAVSEAASNHSVASSLELETEDQNDNLSDMVSANVSGRGTCLLYTSRCV